MNGPLAPCAWQGVMQPQPVERTQLVDTALNFMHLEHRTRDVNLTSSVHYVALTRPVPVYEVEVTPWKFQVNETTIVTDGSLPAANRWCNDNTMTPKWHVG